MSARYRNTKLFGGALSCDIPADFADLSTLRKAQVPVPDHQEIFVDTEGFTSLIIEITERVGPKGNTPEIDGKALSEHLEELVGDDVEGIKVWNTTDTEFSNLRAHTNKLPPFASASPEIPAYTLIATQTPQVDPAKKSSSAPDFTALILTLLRLEEEKTDILITVSVPHIKGSYDETDVDLELGKQGKLIGDAVEFAARIWSSFSIHDWKVFNGA